MILDIKPRSEDNATPNGKEKGRSKTFGRKQKLYKHAQHGTRFLAHREYVANGRTKKPVGIRISKHAVLTKESRPHEPNRTLQMPLIAAI